MADNQKPNTLVLDPEKGFALEYVQDPKGHLWRYGRNLVYLVRRVGETLSPIDLPQKMGEPPEKLYRALHWKKEAAILFTLQNPLLEKLKTIGIYVLIAVLLFFIFLIFSSI